MKFKSDDRVVYKGNNYTFMTYSEITSDCLIVKLADCILVSEDELTLVQEG
jgi:hypothetical protein